MKSLAGLLWIAGLLCVPVQGQNPTGGKTIVTVAASTPELTRKGEGDVIELDDGRLLVVYMEFSGTGSDFAQTRLVAQWSGDGGLNWSGHRVVAETAPGDINVYSPNLLPAHDGAVLLLFMRQHHTNPITSTIYTWRSSDSGASFQPVGQVSNGYYGLCNAVVKRTSSGRLLLPVTVIDKQGTTAHGETYAAIVLLSDDDGRSWRESNGRIQLPMRGVMEPHVQECRDGRMLMVMRSQLGALFLSQSTDDGQTWSKPQTSGLSSPESCPELTQIPSTGDLLMIWNNSPYDPAFRSHFGKRSPLTAAISSDDGRTWKVVDDIESDPDRAFSNPGCRFTRSGHAIINYWTCQYLPNWAMQDVIDLRLAIIDSKWFYR
ncbi:MAG: exo-alpha-sialidase [Pirellulaceae bacterium]|nr:exo-alpha-sialidase [Pirellulaceae bacterium]